MWQDIFCFFILKGNGLELFGDFIMKKTKLFLVTALMSAGLAGCSSVNQGTVSAPLETSLVSAQTAQLSVKPKASARSSQTTIFGFISVGGDNKYADGVSYAGDGSFAGFSGFTPIAKIKAAAAYKILQQSKADVLLAPTYTVQVDDYFLWQHYSAQVQAYPAKIVNITNTDVAVKKVQ